MKVGNIVEPNAKGQIVIPKEVRDQLGIRLGVALNLIVGAGGIHLYPIDDVITAVDGTDFRLKIWEKTAGAWSKDSRELDRMLKRRRKIELEASAKRKKAW
ncbi:TPA: hypothetical protein DD690_01960 [Candidatus Daviesbacteria bacterium]|uniref:SpoVT-AbrB domain-containing protein n=1 Tax=Candidatus Daviesbacteria bacterium GW2011_GWF2_38_6 TaxID=1618432 RepID=A0A0G0KH86_9BACT|nr:MAG: hypothetical protein US80_C0003G0055 [Candidatus Daviesbacteria bacterium GW2011_GWA2_38_17]KKQ78087.1 MAG: hypothetical protein US99_C0030G0003 [Candidatus Daviesbacteria bacterium GW2011_GWF2_38_6]OGE26030.1 MAG: hypothetical protein A3D02_03300 [Candidatus Daviesbacteria bacterium RIFCSPHIGHO2_02_FULL_39_41]OGE44843.1 MAG: hypothetical protein A3E67_00335 [Candidatus Daviesbacteria bacterium RIFCSPHIGHO2_12_FULL_38_25]OGE68048.1 MAG: hypothetical protein A3H81_03570 [Candidatus Davie